MLHILFANTHSGKYSGIRTRGQQRSSAKTKTTSNAPSKVWKYKRFRRSSREQIRNLKNSCSRNPRWEMRRTLQTPTLNNSPSEFRSHPSADFNLHPAQLTKEPKGLFRSSWSKDLFTCLQAFPDIVQNYGAPKKPSSISFASRPRHPWHGISLRFT